MRASFLCDLRLQSGDHPEIGLFKLFYLPKVQIFDVPAKEAESVPARAFLQTEFTTLPDKGFRPPTFIPIPGRFEVLTDPHQGNPLQH